MRPTGATKMTANETNDPIEDSSIDNRQTRRQFLGAATAIATLPIAAGRARSAPDRINYDAIATVKRLLEGSGTWLDPQDIAFNTDLEEGSVRSAIKSMMDGHGMEVGESFVVARADHRSKLYKIRAEEL